MFFFQSLNQTYIVFPDVSYCKSTPVSHPTHSFEQGGGDLRKGYFLTFSWFRSEHIIGRTLRFISLTGIMVYLSSLWMQEPAGRAPCILRKACGKCRRLQRLCSVLMNPLERLSVTDPWWPWARRWSEGSEDLREEERAQIHLRDDSSLMTKPFSVCWKRSWMFN